MREDYGTGGFQGLCPDAASLLASWIDRTGRILSDREQAAERVWWPFNVITSYLGQTVSLERRTGSTTYGEPVWSAAATLPARVQQKVKMVRTTEGVEAISNAQVFLAAGTAVSPGDRVALAGVTYQVLSVIRGQGLDVETHVVAYLGSSKEN